MKRTSAALSWASLILVIAAVLPAWRAEKSLENVRIDAKPVAEAIKTVLDQQGKPDLPLDRVVDSTIVEEVLRERR